MRSSCDHFSVCCVGHIGPVPGVFPPPPAIGDLLSRLPPPSSYEVIRLVDFSPVVGSWCPVVPGTICKC